MEASVVDLVADRAKDPKDPDLVDNIKLLIPKEKKLVLVEELAEFGFLLFVEVHGQVAPATSAPRAGITRTAGNLPPITGLPLLGLGFNRASRGPCDVGRPRSFGVHGREVGHAHFVQGQTVYLVRVEIDDRDPVREYVGRVLHEDRQSL